MSLTKTDLFTIRKGLDTDLPFVLATWLRGAYYGNSWFQEIDKAAFMAFYHGFLERLLRSPGVELNVACLKDDPDVILGYSVTRMAQDLVILDWVFVKTAWRRIGIAKALTPGNLTTVTHLTKIGKSIKPKTVKFYPFI